MRRRQPGHGRQLLARLRHARAVPLFLRRPRGPGHGGAHQGVHVEVPWASHVMAIEELARGPDGLVIRCLRNIGPYENNIFIISDAASSEAYVIDGGFEPEQVAEAARG